ncbi:MAG TPA: hypothetical protein VGH99_13390 [Pseudonocardia sp.]
MTGGFAVHDGDLRAHAAGVGALAHELDRAARAATPLAPGAYGQVGQLFAGHVVRADTGAAEAVGRLAAGVAAHHAALLACAGAYLGHETGAVSLLAGLPDGQPTAAGTAPVTALVREPVTAPIGVPVVSPEPGR